MKTSQQILNDNIDLFEIDYNGLLATSFHSKDNRVIVTFDRVGGGFTMGKTWYHLSLDGIDCSASVRFDLGNIYDKMVAFLGLEECNV